MNSPNVPTQADILAARAIVKSRNHPAHHRDIDAGKWDAWDCMARAIVEAIRRREGEAEGD